MEGKRALHGSKLTASCPVVNDTFLAVGMRVPKSASSTLQDLVIKLAPRNLYTTSNVVQRHAGSKVDRSREESRLCEYLANLPRRTVSEAPAVPCVSPGRGGGLSQRPVPRPLLLLCRFTPPMSHSWTLPRTTCRDPCTSRPCGTPLAA